MLTKPKTLESKSAQRQVALGVMTRVLLVRVKDRCTEPLLAQSREVNQVWNYCQDLSLKNKDSGKALARIAMAGAVHGPLVLVEGILGLNTGWMSNAADIRSFGVH